MKDNENPDFEGRVLSISLRDEKGTLRLADPCWRVIKGRVFLVGRWLENPLDPGPCDGLEAAVAWDEVNHYLVFSSEADYCNRLSGTPREPEAKSVQ